MGKQQAEEISFVVDASRCFTNLYGPFLQALSFSKGCNMKAILIIIGTWSAAACATWNDGQTRYEPLSRLELEGDTNIETPEEEFYAEGDLELENEEVIFEIMRSSKDDADADSDAEAPRANPLDPDLKVDPNKPLLVPSQEGVIVARF